MSSATSDLIKECQEQLAGFKRPRPEPEVDEEEVVQQSKRPAPASASASASAAAPAAPASALKYAIAAPMRKLPPGPSGMAVPTLIDYQNLSQLYNTALMDKQYLLSANTQLDAQNMHLYNTQLIVNQRIKKLQTDMNDLVKLIMDSGFAKPVTSSSSSSSLQ